MLILLLAACHDAQIQLGDTASTGLSDADTDADSDSDTDADSDTDTAGSDDTAETGGPVLTAPSLTGLSVQETDGHVVLTFTAADPDGDLDGGVAHVTYGDQVGDYDLPDSLDTWDGSTGTLTFGFDACDHGAVRTIGLTVDDATGRASNALDTALTLSGASLTVTENGDDYAENQTDLGLPTVFPLYVCGDLYGTADYDWANVVIGTTGDYTVDLDGDGLTIVDDARTGSRVDANEDGSYGLRAGYHYVIAATGGTGDYAIVLGQE